MEGANNHHGGLLNKNRLRIRWVRQNNSALILEAKERHLEMRFDAIETTNRLHFEATCSKQSSSREKCRLSKLCQLWQDGATIEMRQWHGDPVKNTTRIVCWRILQSKPEMTIGFCLRTYCLIVLKCVKRKKKKNVKESNEIEWNWIFARSENRKEIGRGGRET